MMVKRSLLLCLWLVVSCATSPPQNLIRQSVISGDYEKALEVLEKSNIKSKKRNHFLYLLEKGQIHFRFAHYKKALIPWTKARDILKAYYKKTKKDKILNTIANNNYEEFQGEIFEQHQLFFQMSLAYVNLANGQEIEPKKRVRYLASAKAVLLDWDTYIQSLKRNGVKKFYRESFLARFYASHLHEFIGSREDLQIAYQLMKDAFKIKKELDLEVEGGILGGGVKTLIGKSLMRLAKKRGRYKDIKNWEKVFDLKVKNISLNPAIGFINRGMIAAKKSSRVPFGLNYALNNPRGDVKGNILSIGLSVLDQFSLSVLNLGHRGYSPFEYSYIGFQYGGSGGAIEFEMPVREMMRESEKVALNSLQLWQGETMISQVTPHKLISLSQLARASTKVDFNNLYFKTGLRVASKYLIAIIGAYQLYKSMAQNKNNFSSDPMASLAASTSFALSVAAIRGGERADTRYWSSLFDQVWVGELKVKAGEFSLKKGEKVLGHFRKKSQELALFSLYLNNLE